MHYIGRKYMNYSLGLLTQGGTVACQKLKLTTLIFILMAEEQDHRELSRRCTVG
jgi:hypothetical protein